MMIKRSGASPRRRRPVPTRRGTLRIGTRRYVPPTTSGRGRARSWRTGPVVDEVDASQLSDAAVLARRRVGWSETYVGLLMDSLGGRFQDLEPTLWRKVLALVSSGADAHDAVLRRARGRGAAGLGLRRVHAGERGRGGLLCRLRDAAGRGRVCAAASRATGHLELDPKDVDPPA